MKKRKLLITALALSLGCLTGGSGAMAQVSSWEAVYTQTQTSSDSWTKLSAGSTSGQTLGSGGTTTYYYIDRSLNFTNSNPGGSGLKIQGTVYLYLPAGVNITCVGANANGATGAGAGIELTEGNTLYIIGGGNGATVTAKGGNAANGGNGARGVNATLEYDEKILPGSGGNGGNGGGGAGAGIGTCGGNGGAGGAGATANSTENEGTNHGVDGNAGSAGYTAGNMGEFYVENTNGITVTATGGSAATSGGAGGDRGWNAAQDPYNQYTASGGGGGGAGGFGGAAANIGTGGPGGGGGGGGAAGNSAWAGYDFYRVGAGGGKGGRNADGNYASDGVTSELTSMHDAELKAGFDSDDSYTDKGWESGNGMHDGGSGGVTGSASSSKLAISGDEAKKEYNITFTPVKTNINGKTGASLNPLTVQYSPSTGTTVIFPKNKDGYQWALLTYGKDCTANGGTASIFTQATKTFFGGNYDEESYRTELLNDVYGDLDFIEVATTCTLANSGNNTEVLTDFFYNEAITSQKYPVTVRLKDRTLYQDNHWNTLCLPFDMTPSQFNISILQGAIIKEMNTTATGYYPDGTLIPDAMFRKEGPVLYFKFDDVNASTNGLQAGKPYLVKWTSGSNFTDNTKTGNTRHDLDFYNVTVTKLAPQASNGNGITFQGTFSSSETLSAGDKTKLMLGSDDKLYYPSKNINVGACRGYFIIPAAAADAAPRLVIDFDDEMATSIQTLNAAGENQDDAPVYNLQGQRLSAPQKGINIVNGKKVFVK